VFISLIQLKAKDSYQQHQAIWSLFPNRPEDIRDHLFRIESVEGSAIKALLQSATEPTTSKEASVLQSKRFILQLENTRQYRFKVTANPTKKDSRSGRLLDLVSEEEQVAWLQRKLEGARLTVTSIDSKLINYHSHQFTRFVTFEGVIQVEDVDRVQEYVVKGIGRKKHAGAGLLSLARMI
jgi:CRISPR system Cascade subunit CasE